MQKKLLLLISFVLLCLWIPIGGAADHDQADPSDYLELDLVRQIYLVEQTQKLTALIVELAEFPEEVIEILLASEKLNADSDRIKAALVAFQSAQTIGEEKDVVNGSGKPQRIETPKLTGENILFVTVPQIGIPGTAMFQYEGNTYSAHLGGSFKIRGKKYTVVGIKYLSANEIAVSVKTKSGITRLEYKE